MVGYGWRQSIQLVVLLVCTCLVGTATDVTVQLLQPLFINERIALNYVQVGYLTM